MLTESRLAMKKHWIAEQFALSKSLHTIERLKNSEKISCEEIFYFENSDLEMHARNIAMLPIREIGERY